MGKTIDSADTALWDSFNADLVELAGTDASLYVLRADEARDPLYDEPTAFMYDGPYSILVTVRQPDREIDVTERGKERIQTTQVWFSRAHLEDRECPIPKEGDVLGFWGGQYDLEDIKDESQVPTNARSNPDAPWSIQFVLNAKRRERFLPERKTGGSAPPPEDTL